MKSLKDILAGVDMIEIRGDLSVPVRKIQFDSRQVEAGDLFVAVKGSHVDGHQFIEKALEKGAIAVVCEDIPENFSSRAVWIRIEGTQLAFGKIAAAFYNHPSANLKVVGVTGTNGKTTIANFAL